MPIPRSKTSAGMWLEIGEPRLLPTIPTLPTRRDVVRCFKQKSCGEKVLRDGKDPSAKYFALSVALHVMEVRDKASLPVILLLPRGKLF